MSSNSQPLLVVGIGASAGGLEALTQFFETVPKDAPMAFVIAQHLDPHHESMMSEILSRKTSLSFCQVIDSQAIKAGHAYIIPPDAHIEVVNNKIEIVKSNHRRGSRLAIDHLFRSMAEQYHSRAVGMILSGTGSDGTAGLRAIKAAGGLAIVQTPETAEYPSMPESAVDAGVVDQVLSTQDMFKLLLEYAKHPYHEITASEAKNTDVESLKVISSLLKVQENFTLDQYKETTVLRRLFRRMSLTTKTDHESYIQLLRDSAEERQMLMKDLLINVTDFFRDQGAFEILQNAVIKNIVDDAEQGTDIRVWIAGCASGEEAYSVAILFAEEIAQSGRDLRLKIFATDVDDEVIRKARRGIYSASMLSELPANLLDKYFQQHDDSHYIVTSELRKSISFASQNVYTDPPFSKIHLVCCRNLLIYLKNSVQQKVLKSLSFSLLPEGYLFLGSSENLGEIKERFAPISQKWRIFSQADPSKRSVQSSVSPSFFNKNIHLDAPKKPKLSTSRLNGSAGIAMLAALRPSVLLDENHRVLYFHGNVNKYLQLPNGDAELNFFNMLEPNFRTRVRSAIFKAKKSGEQVSSSPPGLVESNAPLKARFSVDITPLEADHNSQASVIVSFLDIPSLSNDKRLATEKVDHSGDQEKMINAIERELLETKDELQNTIEELETRTEDLKAVHEEALSTNEELQSSNEELEASTEELRSLNEELKIVNAELKEKIDELLTTQNDLTNFFASTNSATVFLSNQLLVKRYTPAAERLLRLGSQDINKPLGEISHQFIDESINQEAEQVLENLKGVEKEIQIDERWFQRKILPYRTQDRRIDGVVLTFNDITHLKNAVKNLQRSGQQHEVVSRLGIEALSIRNIDNFIDRLVREVAYTLKVEFSNILEYLPAEGHLLLKAGVGWDRGLVGVAKIASNNSTQAGFTLNTESPVITEDVTQEQRFSASPLLNDHKVVSGLSCIIEGNNHPFGVLGVHTKTKRRFSQDDSHFLVSVANILSVTLGRKATEQQLKENEKRLRVAKDSNRMGSFEFEFKSQKLDWDEILIDIWGMNKEEVNFDTFVQQIHPEDIAAVRLAMERSAKNQDGGHYQATYRVINKKSAKLSWVEATGQVIFDNNEADKMFGMIIDVTEKMELESSLKAVVIQMRDADEKKNQFLATLGHEIRNPLAAINSGLQIVEQDHSQLPRALSMIENNVGVISLLLDDLLDLTRISRGQIELRRRIIDVNELLAEIYDGFLPKFKQKQQNVRLILPNDRVFAPLDKVRINQAISNIINNAHKFTPAHGNIQIALRTDDEQLRISIKDTGIGLDTSMREKIFEPFHQVSYNARKGNAGMGIGLALVKQFAILHKGSVAVESEGLGTGSEFILTLPLTHQTNQQQAAVEAKFGLKNERTSTENFHLLRVLITDDNEDAAYGLSLILQAKGCQVHTCKDGQSALDEYAKFNPNVLILDIGLPDISGHDLLISLLALSSRDRLLSIALTGFGHKEAQEKSTQAGFDYHMTKPVRLYDLLHFLSLHADQLLL